MNWLSKISSSGKIVAYHATIAGTKILNTGFKTRQQLSDFSALGGGTNDSISFTTDWSVAKGIFDSFIFAWNLANKITSPQEVLSQSSPQLQLSIQKMFNSSEGDLKNKINGWRREGVFGFGDIKQPKTESEITEMGYKVDPDSNPLDGQHFSWLRPLSDQEYYNYLYSFLKSYYAAHSSENTGVYNPVFFCTNIQNFIGVDRQDIGIISAEILIDPTKGAVDDYHKKKTHRYVGSMAELRVFDLNIITQILDYDTKPEDKPKIQTQQYYHGESDQLENYANDLLKVIYKYYSTFTHIFSRNNIAIDGLISVIQEYGSNPRKFSEMIVYINKALKIKEYSYDIQQYMKYKKLIVMPDDIKNLLHLIPQEYVNNMINGENVDDVFSKFYDNDKIGYDQWWSATQNKSNVERYLSDYFYDRTRNMKYYETYVMPSRKHLEQYFQNDAEITASFALIQAIEQINKRWNFNTY